MRKNSGSYKVVFQIEGITLRQQQEIYDLLRKSLSFSMKDHFSITVEDSVGGRHNLWENTGTKPNGDFCKNCTFVDCQYCIEYKGEENE